MFQVSSFRFHKITATLIISILGMFFFTSSISAASVDTEEQAFVDLLNAYRKSLGKTELKITKPLLNGADYFAEYFANNPDDSDANIHKDSAFGGPEERGDYYGFYFLTENIGWGYETGQAIFDSWKASEGHRENMISSGGRTVGISRYYKAGATKDGLSVEWFWIMDMSDEGLERLAGNNLTDSEMYSRSYKKISVTIKKKNKAGKYKPKKWAEIKVYDNATGRLIDHDIADKNGRCKVYILGNGKKVKLKVASFKGNKTKSFTISGKKVKSKTINWIKNKKYAIKI